jgi:tetratricopeptide (TPR) repeat protein
LHTHKIAKAMNAQLNELYSKIYQNEENQQPLSFISIVDPVIETIVCSDLSGTIDFPKATKLLTDYGIHLANTGKFSRAIVYLNKAAELFENDKKTKGKPITQIPVYETILLYRGVAYFNIRKYKKARIDLKRLALTFPQNFKYKNWFNKTVNREMTVYQFIIVLLLGVTALVYFYSKNSNGYANTISYSVMVGCVVCAFVVDILKRRRKLK